MFLRHLDEEGRALVCASSDPIRLERRTSSRPQDVEAETRVADAEVMSGRGDRNFSKIRACSGAGMRETESPDRELQ